MNYNENIILNCNSFLWKIIELDDVLGWERNFITRMLVIGIRRKIEMFVQ
jgi:hypothetical protein